MLILLTATTAHAATFNCQTGDVACLVSAIHTANTNGDQTNVITLAAGTYTATNIDNDTDGLNALPSVARTLTITSTGATIQRDVNAPGMRIFHVETQGTLNLENITLDGGKSGESWGGALFNAGRVQITGGGLTHNAATWKGGALYNSGQASLIGTNISQNTGFTSRGVLYNEAGATLTIDQSTMIGNQPSKGGVILSLGGTVTVTNSLINDNLSGYEAGAIEITATTLNIDHVTISNNVSDGTGALRIISGTVSIANSSFIGNLAAGTGSAGAIQSGGTVTIVSTTFWRNRSDYNMAGRTISNSGGTMSLLNSTLLDDDKNLAGSGSLISTGTAATTSIQNTILAHIGGDRLYACNGALTSLGHNVISNLAGGCVIAAQPSDLTVEAQLDVFTDDADPGSGYFALLAGSPAINAGTNCPATDQLGQPRIGACDIGAIEFVPPTSPATPVTANPVPLKVHKLKRVPHVPK